MNRIFLHYTLLLAFIVLAVSGGMAYFFPFSLTSTRVHIISASIVIVFVTWHLVQRSAFFNQTLGRNRKRSLPFLLTAVLISGLWLLAAYQNWLPARWIMQQSYENQKFLEIVRSSPSVFGQFSAQKIDLIKQNSSCGEATNRISLALEARVSSQLLAQAAIAIWAETTKGSLIETLYVSPALAYSDRPDWHGKSLPRHHILPVWRNKLTLLTGLDTDGEIDSLSGATESHKSSLQAFLDENTDAEYIVYFEYNLPYDSNEKWQDSFLGQPSILYSSYISHLKNSKQHAILELTGHGGGEPYGGAVNYQTDSLTGLQKHVDLLLLSSFPCESSSLN